MKSSYEKINYSVRPAKCIERKMLCESFRRLSIFGKVESYCYVGFGSTFFSDFTLLHKSLNLTNMISVEKDERNKPRFEFNKPFRCIDIVYGLSNKVLPQLHWEPQIIMWLDYDGILTRDVLLDAQTFCANAIPGSVIIISVNAEPTFERGQRLQKLIEAVGETRIPVETRERDLAKWGSARTARKIIYNEISQALSEKNGVRRKGKLCYKQLFNFHYSDGAKMLTTGGLIYDETQEHLLAQCAFDDLTFIRTDDEEYLIEVPSLTFKEIRYLDEQLPSKDGENLEVPAVKQGDIDKYKKVYRYFPAFAEANL